LWFEAFLSTKAAGGTCEAVIRNTCMCVCVLWTVIGCLDTVEPPGKRDTDCSVAGLTEHVDEELESVDMDAACDVHLLSDPWTGERANCVSTEPDPAWREGPWLKTREYCITHSCVLYDEINYGTGFGVLKNGTMTLDTLHVREAVETDVGWDIIIVCGCDDEVFSLHIPLRVYSDLDLQCLNEINVAVPGYIEFDSLAITVKILGGVVQEPLVEMNDPYVYVEVSGIPEIDATLSDIVSWIASWVQNDLEELFGQAVKERVEAAYGGFAQDCK
jgi:hypothetical protein